MIFPWGKNHHPLQGKDPLVEVMKEVFSVIKLAKTVKKTFAAISFYGYKGFGGDLEFDSAHSLEVRTLQGKDPLVEVIKEVFSVIKLAKIVKKTYATTFVYGYGGFGRAFNVNSTQIKKMGGRRLLRMMFSSMR